MGGTLSTGIVRCPACGTDNGLRAKFCNECGAALPERGAGGIVRDLSERKFVTILFADIRNSTGMVQDLDPEDAMAKLRPAIDLMISAVREAGGMVNRVHGDGVMALFGAPVAVDNHATRACRAALLMKSRVADLADRDISIRVGVHSGEVVTHIDAGDFSNSYDVTGQAAHFAARLEQAAEPNTVLISQDTWTLVRAGVEARQRHGLDLKGFDRATDVWELTGLGQGSRWLARQASGLSPFVGRTDQLNALKQRLSLAQKGNLQVLTIGGEPGTGKSRLLHELIGSEMSGAWDLWAADAEATSSQGPHAVLRRLLLAWLGVDQSSTREDLAATLRSRAGVIDLPPGGAAALASLLNLPVEDDPTWKDLDPPSRNLLISATLVEVLDATQRIRPLMLIVEDFHWADVESRTLLLKLADRLPDGRIAVVITHQPMDGLPAESDHFLPVDLIEFSSAAAARFLDRLLGHHASTDAIKRQLLESTGRLPFFLEEAVRHLVEQGALSGAAGAYLATAGEVRVAMPRSAQAVAAARIDSLDGPLKTLVRNASAIGKRFPRLLLSDIGAGPQSSFDEAIRELVRRHILVASADGSGEEIEFRHEFIREAAYGAMLRDQRQVLHRAIMAAIETRFTDRLRDWTTALAHHATEAQAWAKAVDYERGTAEAAIEASSYAVALAACTRALEHLKRLPPTRDRIEREIDLRLLLRATVSPTDFRLWVDHATIALSLAEEIGDATRQLMASAHRAWALNFGGVPKEAIEAAEKALRLATAAKSESAMCTASLVLGQASYLAGNYRQATEAFRFPMTWLAGPRRLTRHGAGTTLAIVHMMRAFAYAWMGEFPPAHAAAVELSTLSAETRRPYDLAMTMHARGYIALQERRYDDAITEFTDALSRCREAELRGLMPIVLTYLGASFLEVNRVDDAAQALEEALMLSKGQNFVAAQIAASTYMSGVLLKRGRARAAAELADDSRQRAAELGYGGHENVARRFLAAATKEIEKPIR